MADQRRWKAEEKLVIIKDVKENGKVVETCRKYSIDPGDVLQMEGIIRHFWTVWPQAPLQENGTWGKEIDEGE